MSDRVGSTKGALAARAIRRDARSRLAGLMTWAAICSACVALPGIARANDKAPARDGRKSALAAPADVPVANGDLQVACGDPDRAKPRKVSRSSSARRKVSAAASRSAKRTATQAPAKRATAAPQKGTRAVPASRALQPAQRPTVTPPTRQVQPAQRPIVTPPTRQVQPAQRAVPKAPPVPVAQRTAPDPSRRISVNFANVSARDALAAVAEHTGVDILITPGTTGNVSISLRERTADEAIRQIAAVGGLSVGVIGSTYVVGPPPEVQKAVSELGKTEVVTLRYAKPEQAKDVLSRAVPRLSVETTGNTVVISGLPEDIQTARKALDELDVAPPDAPAPAPRTEFAILQNADPAQVERMLCDAFPKLKVARQDRLFTFTGSPADLESASRAVKMLDAQAPARDARVVTPVEAARETAVYELRFVNGKRAEETLKKLLPGLVIAEAPEPTAPPPALFQPLSLGMMGGTSGGSGGGFSFGGSGSTSSVGMSGGANAQPLSRSTRLILMGSPADIAAARTILEQTDVAPPLVRIEAAILEVNKTLLRELGIEWDFNNTGFTAGFPSGEKLAIGNIRFNGPGGPGTDASFAARLQALMTESRAKLIANPSISVVDNEDANIFIGDLRRFRGISVVSPDVGTVQGTETIPVGVALLVRPRIHPDGAVTLKVHPVVSTVSDIVDGLPQTASREADTTVRLNRGEQLVIGGLDREDLIRQVRRVPLLGQIPLIGELFTSRSTRTVNTEIIILIAAYPAQAEPAPTVREFPRPIGEPVR